MAKIDRRQKASDVFRESNFLLARKVTFAEAFPEIETLRVEVQESPRYARYGGEPATYTQDTIGEYVDCSNRLCWNGGASVGSVIRGMTHERKTEESVQRSCQGREGSPKGRRQYGICGNFFKVKVQIKYRA